MVKNKNDFNIFIDNTCYIANLGNSKAILSLDNGSKIDVITKEHTPKNENER